VSVTDTPQFRAGKLVEFLLDDYFRGRGWTVRILTASEERGLKKGDRELTHAERQPLLVEYKSGIQTLDTRNLYLETISVDRTGTPGWVYTCRADLLLYTIPNAWDFIHWHALIFRPAVLRGAIAELERRHPARPTHDQNRGYKTHGVVVPEWECKPPRLAEKEISFSITPEKAAPLVALFPREKARHSRAWGYNG